MKGVLSGRGENGGYDVFRPDSVLDVSEDPVRDEFDPTRRSYWHD
jgi:hypothetical protein